MPFTLTVGPSSPSVAWQALDRVADASADCVPKVQVRSCPSGELTEKAAGSVPGWKVMGCPRPAGEPLNAFTGAVAPIGATTAVGEELVYENTAVNAALFAGVGVARTQSAIGVTVLRLPDAVDGSLGGAKASQ